MKRLAVVAFLLVTVACAPVARSTQPRPTVEATTPEAGQPTARPPVADTPLLPLPPALPLSATLASIDSTGTTDVTDPLNAVLASLPDGSSLFFAPHGRYRIEGTLLLSGKSGITLDGQGATFFATTDGHITPPSNCTARSTAAVCRYPNRTRSQWSLVSDHGVTVQSMVVRGSSTSTGPNGVYNASLEAQHGINIVGSTEATVRNVDVGSVWGDLIYVGGVGPSPSSGVTVSDSTLVGASRQGVSVTDADHVTFRNNTISSARRSLIDLEANTSNDEIGFVTFTGNALGSARFSTVSNYGAQGDEHDIVFDSNHTLPGAALKIGAEGSTDRRRYNYFVTNNIGPMTNFPLNGSQNDPMVVLAYVDHATVTGNTLVFAAQMGWPTRTGLGGSPQAPVMVVCATGSDVSGNTFTKPAGMPDSIDRPC